MDRRIGAVGLTIGLTLTVVAPALAQNSSPGASPWTTVVQGLGAPRGLAFGSDGTLYVGEQGFGGDLCQEDPDTGQGCVGLTGGISAIKDGVATRVVDGLPSLAGDEGVGGASDFAITADGTFIIAMGLGGGPEARAQFPPEIGANLGFLVSATAGGFLNGILCLVWTADEAGSPEAEVATTAADVGAWRLAIRGTDPPYAANGHLGILVGLDLGDVRVTGRMATPYATGSDELAIAPDGQTLFLAGPDGMSSVSTGDLVAAGDVLRTPPLAGIAITPDGRWLYGVAEDGTGIVELAIAGPGVSMSVTVPFVDVTTQDQMPMRLLAVADAGA